MATTTLPELQELTTMQATMARGYLWLRMLEDGRAKSIWEIAKKEGVDERYVARGF